MAGKTFVTTVSVNGEVDASIQKAFSGLADKLGAIQKAAAATAGATEKLSIVIEAQTDELEAAKKARPLLTRLHRSRLHRRFT